MTPQRQALLLQHLPDASRYRSGEATLMPPLLRWLVATGRVRARTRVVHEVPWLGRRVDLALLTGRGATASFELKLGRLQRVLEQAAYNRSSFHRSWVVTGNRPRPEGLAWASALGVGLLVVQRAEVVVLAMPSPSDPHSDVARRLRAVIRARAEAGA